MLEQAIKLGFVIKTLENVPGKKALHKMIYLLQKMGLELGYSFEWLTYGPFSRELSNQLDKGLGIGSIAKERGKFIAGDLFRNSRDIFKSKKLSEEDMSTIERFKEEFADVLENPHMLELLASLHFLATESYPKYRGKKGAFKALEKQKPGIFRERHKGYCWYLLDRANIL